MCFQASDYRQCSLLACYGCSSFDDEFDLDFGTRRFRVRSTIPSRRAIVYTRKVKVKFALEQAMRAQRGSKGITLLFL